MGALDGRHALVTGGGTGIGAAVARTLAGEGAALTLAGRRREPLEEVAADLPNAAVVPADVTDEASVVDMIRQAETAHGPVDILIANAGAAESAPIAKTSLELWQRMLTVNLTGAFLCARAVLPGMSERGWGRVVFMASTAGLKGYAYVASYCAAKHGVVGLTRALALEAAKSGATVNAICPGFTETPLLADSIANIVETTGRSEDDARQSLVATNPQGRFIQPDEVAGTALWLCGPGAAAITGQAISVSGGEI
ncbi:MAG: SDR family oxidoreductase [Alphaproteobacteria bacterium]|nr:SDR family oxidoreductase [Alphaproteobacteria bacterium]